MEGKIIASRLENIVSISPVDVIGRASDRNLLLISLFDVVFLPVFVSYFFLYLKYKMIERIEANISPDITATTASLAPIILPDQSIERMYAVPILTICSIKCDNPWYSGLSIPTRYEFIHVLTATKGIERDMIFNKGEQYPFFSRYVLI